MPASVSYTIPGLHVTDHSLEVPLDWSDDADPRRLTVFARELVAPHRRHEDLPLLLFLQGGPGGKSPRPTGPDGWVGAALATHRVVLLDQRGTGRSSAVRAGAMAGIGDVAAQAEYLSRFRADAIVADAEHLRRTVYGGARWATLGQSYGGFVTLTYLSRAPEALTACYVTGGLAGLDADAREVYRRTYPRVGARNARYRERYPHDTDRIARVADRIAAGDVLLPDGDRLSVARFQSMGIGLGMGPGAEELHWLVDEAFDADGDTLTDTFLTGVADQTSFRTNPLYAVLHESIYGSGPGATGWAAEAERPAAFDPGARPLAFTGEMVYPWMFDQISGLRPFAGAAEALADRREWPELYDPVRLAANDVPVEAAVYHDDMYVDAGLSLDTASRVGNLEAWVTNEFEHDGLRTADVFARLRARMDARGGEPR